MAEGAKLCLGSLLAEEEKHAGHGDRQEKLTALSQPGQHAVV